MSNAHDKRSPRGASRGWTREKIPPDRVLSDTLRPLTICVSPRALLFPLISHPSFLPTFCLFVFRLSLSLSFSLFFLFPFSFFFFFSYHLLESDLAPEDFNRDSFGILMDSSKFSFIFMYRYSFLQLFRGSVVFFFPFAF